MMIGSGPSLGHVTFKGIRVLAASNISTRVPYRTVRVYFLVRGRQSLSCPRLPRVAETCFRSATGIRNVYYDMFDRL